MKRFMPKSSAFFLPPATIRYNRQIQSAWRNAMIEAEETSVVAIAARLQAIDSLKQLYGLYPENKKPKISRNFPRTKSRLSIMTSYLPRSWRLSKRCGQRIIRLPILTRSSNVTSNCAINSDSQTKRSWPKQFPCINRTYCNRERENQLLQIYQLFQDVLKISLPKDDDKLEQEIRQLIAAGIVAPNRCASEAGIGKLAIF